VVVDGRTVDAVRESWLVEDRWWTDRPLRRRYWEVVTTCGRNDCVFRELNEGRWYRQR
jgi:CO dehydrogenase/acetyl-CoA synthase delta subunit